LNKQIAPPRWCITVLCHGALNPIISSKDPWSNLPLRAFDSLVVSVHAWFMASTQKICHGVHFNRYAEFALACARPA
jgi:hypothetical protein